ncbi:peptide chain release factor 1, mitochondrial isoform X1 [Fundulus heteroclitus]|uniref:peptide chain release factor 1, mitochondrial isoform X1 n=1 Tax=Fundulus heteroclitus TaxID=8078 RepID=UPI00165B7986|nr:peptide chain release factor 1, mitochondrial isoform X1 [Fundulus heteroclitus]XP_012712086.2 peptide chain release factor 1, mitochondrial isoform X1 [Fundulus heteroclitus]
MFFTRWFGLCSQCSRVASRCELGWITRTGQSRRKYADFTGVQRLATSIVPKRNSHYDLGNLYNNISVQRYLQKLMEEHRFISRKLQHEHLSDPDRKALLKKHAELQSLADVSGSIEQAQKDLEEVLSLLHTSAKDEDEHLIQLLKEEEAQICSNILALRKDLIKALVPIDPLDSSDVVLEVVSGRTTGGDICQQFTREMFEMYQGFSYYKNWDFEVLNLSPAEYGGLHHAAVRVTGNNVYRHLKHEGGTHRVQKIPEIGLSSRMQRIHTGTMTVIILPQPVEFDVHIDPKDLRIDTLRSRGPGGQGVNTTDSAVRIVHLPTGITAECQQTRSQLQNRDTAMRVLRARLVQCMMSKETEQRHTARKQQVGTRSQAERIRTYNFSQDRVTDHRTGYTTKDIKEFMKGGKELEDLVSDLLEHSEKEAVMEAVETSICLT